MTSPLAGSLARTIGKALASTFLPAVLTRAGTAYPCRAILDQWGKESGPGGALTNPDVRALVLANSLAVEPESGDVVALQGYTFVVVSNQDTKPAVSTDPARAVWTLIGKFVMGTDNTVDLTQAYAATAAALGQPYAVYRSAGNDPLATTPLQTTPVIVTSAKAAGYSYTRSSTFDDVLFALQADFTNVQIGDYLVGPGGTFFIADMPSLRPVVAVQCNALVTVTRPNTERAASGGQGQGYPSQPGSTGRYRGVGATESATGPGETVVHSGIPANMTGTTGASRSQGELPSDSAGPSRWRIYLPRSAFPHGSVEDRDIVTDDLGQRHQVSSDYWSAIGYRVEAVRLEN